MADELTTAAATLIATLPDDAGDLSVPQLDAFMELQRAILAVGQEYIEAGFTVSDLARARGATNTDTIGPFITDEEKRTFDLTERRALDAERAGDALRRWEKRAGLDRIWRDAGVEMPEPPDRRMMLSEEPDGTIVHEIGPWEAV